MTARIYNSGDATTITREQAVIHDSGVIHAYNVRMEGGREDDVWIAPGQWSRVTGNGVTHA